MSVLFRSEVRGGDIPTFASKDVEPEAYGFDRLERAVASLVEEHERMQKLNTELRHEVTEQSKRIRSLEEQLLDANQRRQDVSKRVDELIAELDQLDAQLGSVEEPA